MQIGGCKTELEEKERRVAEGEAGHAWHDQEGGEVEDISVEGDGGGDIADVEAGFEEVAWRRWWRHCEADLLRRGSEQFTLIER